MNRTMIALISILIVIAVVAIAESGPNVTGASFTGPQAADGCTTCHPKLSEKVPEGHFKATLNEVKYCLACHSLEGAASAFAWTRHQNHYATLGPAATCWVCHQIDAAGHFRLIGVEGGKEIKVTPAVVEKMGSYYQSAATSEHLDHRHAQRSVTCQACHGTAFPETAATKEQCFKCHGSYEQIAEKAPIHYNAIYPHFSDRAVECNACHKPHSKSVLVCNQCHSFEEEVP